MKTIAFTKFRQTAASCLDEVEKGEKIRVLRYGRPIADIVPVSDHDNNPTWKQPALKLRLEGASLSKEIFKEREQAER